MSGKRTPIAAREAERSALERALAASLTGSELRVLIALVVKITKFDRTEDRVPNSVLSEMTGIAPRHIREAVAGLASKGIIDREPGSGRIASLYRFGTPEGTESGTPEGTESGTPEGTESGTPEGTESAMRGDAHAPPRVHAQRATSEVLSEAPSEVESGPPRFIARELLKRNQFEADDVVERSIAAYGEPATMTMVTGFRDAGTTFTFASELWRAIQSLQPTGPTATARPHWTPCGDCVNGMVETDAGVTRCTCNPARAMAATA